MAAARGEALKHLDVSRPQTVPAEPLVDEPVPCCRGLRVSVMLGLQHACESPGLGQVAQETVIA